MKTLSKFTPAIKGARHIKKAILALGFLASVITANAQGYHWVNPHYDHNGIYYRGHMQGNPDGNPYNNLSYLGGSYPYFIY